MALAVELYFDARTERTVDSLREEIHAAGIEPSPLLTGARPHVSLALVETDDVPRLSEVVDLFAADTERCPVTLVSLASFSSSKGVLFLAPVPTRRLLELHARFYARLAAERLEFDELYAPGSWVPHCTLEMGLSGSQLATAFDSCWRSFSPVSGELVAAGVVSYPPPSTHSVSLLDEPASASET
ncbi:MAG TPA: 2'-5' RNA ligase family protein [Trueperaceae bacterium]